MGSTREPPNITLFFGSRHSPCKARLVFDFESFPKLLVQSKNKPGPAQVGAISRLKNSKKTSKCQVLFYSTRKSKFFENFFFEKITYSKKWTEWRAKVSQCRITERGDPLRFFNIHSVAKHEKIEENKNFYSREKISMPKKTERGDPLGFFNIHSVAKHQKNAGGPFGEQFFFGKKSRSSEENERGSLWFARCHDTIMIHLQKFDDRMYLANKSCGPIRG